MQMAQSDKVATGGTVKRIGLTNMLTHTFTKSDELIIHRPTLIRYLVVGGRGGGPTKDTKPVADSTKLNTLDQEGGNGEVVEGTTTYKLKPGTYKITVAGRSIEFTTKQIAGTGYSSRFMGNYPQYCIPPWNIHGTWQTVYYNVNTPTAWTAQQRVFTAGNPTSIEGVADAKGGAPHPGISDQPSMTSSNYTGIWNGWYGQASSGAMVCLGSTGGNYPGGPKIGYVDIKKSSSWPYNAEARPAYNMNDDKTWKDAINNRQLGQGAAQAKANVAAQKESDITGTTQKYGLTPMVIISYDESKAGPAGPSPEEIAAIVKEYERKMAEYRAQVAAEKKAMMDQNQAAVSAAKAEQEKLVTELTSLKTRYDQLQQTAQTTETTLQSTQQQLVALNAEYTQKMKDLDTARQAEIKALTDQNQAAVAAAKAEQEKLVGELTTLKTTYDALVSKSAECPIIPEGTTLVDGGTGQMYKAEKGALRPLSMDVYRAMGSPAYTTYPSGSLDQCSTGPPYVIPTSTSAPSTTAAPSTDPQFPGTLYVILHAASWLKNKELKVLASRFGTLEVEAFQFKALEQVFVINNTGYIRSVAGDGLYLTNAGDCLSPVMSKEAPLSPWRISRAGTSPLEYTLISSCGASLKASLGAQAAILEEGVFGSEVSENWYIVPVGRAQI